MKTVFILLIVATVLWLVWSTIKSVQKSRSREKHEEEKLKDLLSYYECMNEINTSSCRFKYDYERYMTAAELKKWHQINRMKREPIVFKWDDVIRIDPDAFREGDVTLMDGFWHEHNGSEWVKKYKYNNQ